MTNRGSDWRREQFRRTLEHWRASNFDPHVVLGIPRGAPKSLIIDSHRRWVTAYHPDRHDGDPLATELTQRLNAARDELFAGARRSVQSQPERQRRQAEAQPQRAAQEEERRRQEEERELQAYIREERRRQEDELDQAVLEAEQLIRDAARKKHRQSQVREQRERVPEDQRRKQDKERRRRANKAKQRKQEKARLRRARKAGKRDKKRR